MKISTKSPVDKSAPKSPEPVSPSECITQFVTRESPLTTLCKTPGGQVLYSIILSTTTILFLLETTRYYFNVQLLHDDLAFLYRLFGTVDAFFLVGVCTHIPIFLILFPVARMHGKYGSAGLFKWTAIAVCTMIAVTPVTLVQLLDSSIMVRWMIGIEHVRVMLKVVAYSIEIYRSGKQQQVKDPNDNDQKDEKDREGGMFTLKSLAYYMVAPVLIFRSSSAYPSLGRGRRVQVILGNLFDILMLGFWGFLVYRRLYEPTIWQLGVTAYSHLSVDYVITVIWSSILLGWCNLMGIGIGFLHSWLNMWAEILDFGDRQFYKSWWHVRGINEFMRTWNFLIHSWISAYFYQPVRSLTGSKQMSQLAVILGSAFIHDYIMSLSFGFITSVFSAIVICVVIPTFVFASPASYLQGSEGCNFFTFLVLHMTAAVMGFMGGADVATRTVNCFRAEKSLYNPMPGFFDCKW